MTVKANTARPICPTCNSSRYCDRPCAFKAKLAAPPPTKRKPKK